MQIKPGSYLKIVSPTEHDYTHFPFLLLSDYEHSLNESSWKSYFYREPVKPETYFINTLELSDGFSIWVNFPLGEENLDHTIVAMCASQNAEIDGFFWYADQIQSIRPAPE